MEQMTKTQTPAWPEPPESSGPCRPREWALLWILGLTLVLAVSRQSLWIDEAYTAASSSQGSLRECWSEIDRNGGSDLQMPRYMILHVGLGQSGWQQRVGLARRGVDLAGAGAGRHGVGISPPHPSASPSCWWRRPAPSSGITPARQGPTRCSWAPVA